MALMEHLAEYVRACFTGIWIESHEQQDALMAIMQLCQQEAWQLATWNIEQGLRVSGAAVDNQGGDPLAAIRAVNSLATPEGTAILVLQNFHRFLSSAEIVQALLQQIVVGKQNRTIVVILSPVVQLPLELEKLFVVLEHELPDREQLAEIARGIATEETELPSGSDLDIVLDAAAGLTRMEAENAFSLSLVRHGRISSEAVWELKSGMLKKSGMLELHRGQEDFSRMGGLASLKSFCKAGAVAAESWQPVKAATWCVAVVAAGVWEVAVLQVAREGSREAGVDARRRKPDGLARRAERGTHAAGTADHRRDGPLCRDD